MARSTRPLILGEHTRTVDERYRLSIPPELAEEWVKDGAEIVIAKERPGCLSLWDADLWRTQMEGGVRVVESKYQEGRLSDRRTQLQTLGRLMSTRHRSVSLAGRGRLVIPEGFREFLGIEPPADVFVVGAAVCIEVWQRDAWLACLREEIPQYNRLLDDLSR